MIHVMQRKNNVRVKKRRGEKYKRKEKKIVLTGCLS